MKHTRPAENTGRVVVLAAGFFGTLTAFAWWEGVFAKLGGETLAALVFFAIAFAAATYGLDRGVRDWINCRLGKRPATRLRRAPAKSPGGSPAAS